MGSLGTSECSHTLATTIATCSELRVPLAEDKTEGPDTKLSFLSDVVYVHNKECNHIEIQIKLQRRISSDKASKWCRGLQGSNCALSRHS